VESHEAAPSPALFFGGGTAHRFISRDRIMSRRVLLSWSSGKDSAWCLHVLRKDPEVEVVGLLTTVNTTHGRVAMHSTRLAIVEAQARAVGLPLHIIPLPWACSN
jgi:tRNA(Ile)-lysidine synthase TilS/MesJ